MMSETGDSVRPYERRQFFADAWAGREQFSRVAFAGAIVPLGFALLVSIILLNFPMQVSWRFESFYVLWFLIVAAYGVFSLACLWRCAYNGPERYVGDVGRMLTVMAAFPAVVLPGIGAATVANHISVARDYELGHQIQVQAAAIQARDAQARRARAASQMRDQANAMSRDQQERAQREADQARRESTDQYMRGIEARRHR